MSKYIQTKSVSWWSAVAEASVNVLRGFGVPVPVEVDGLILAIFGIGIRAAIGGSK